MKKLISTEYRQQNAQMHDDPTFGISKDINVDAILDLAVKFGAKTILDYGCGKGLFKQAMAAKAPQFKVYEYDPAIDGKKVCRDRADMVVCNDVMEHIEPHLLDNVLAHISEVARKGAMFTIAHTAAKRIMPDGRNAHLIQEPYEWWQLRLRKHFPVVQELGAYTVTTPGPLQGTRFKTVVLGSHEK